MTARAQSHGPIEVVGIILALGLLTALLQAGSPGFALSSDGVWTMAKFFPSATQKKIEKIQKNKRGKDAKKVERTQAIPTNADIPNLYVGLYQEYAGDNWRIVAGIYKIESDHGQSHAPGVRSGVNAFGCCAGPGQFNVRNGHPSTWERWRSNPRANVYDPRDSVPATVKMLRSFHAQRPGTKDWRGGDCGTVPGLSAKWINAVKHYNNACFYAREVAGWVRTYSKSPAKPEAKVHGVPKGLSFTTSHGCNPAQDWRRGLWTPEVRGFLIKLVARHSIRVSCGVIGHNRFVKGTHRESAHWTGRAFDVDKVDGQPVSPATPHTDLGRAALDYGAKQVGGPVALCGGKRCFTDDGHKDHWHIQP